MDWRQSLWGKWYIESQRCLEVNKRTSKHELEKYLRNKKFGISFRFLWEITWTWIRKTSFISKEPSKLFVNYTWGPDKDGLDLYHKSQNWTSFTMDSKNATMFTITALLE